MNKIEFSDLNKFLTSIGLIFIGIAILLPWYVNQNSTLITLEEDKIGNYTSDSQTIITNQQQYLLFISQNILCIVIVLLVIGFGLLTWGIVRWRDRQSVRDEKENAELDALKKRAMSSKEKEAIIEGEIESDTPIENKTETIQKYLNIENLIYFKISEHYRVNYINSQNIKIGTYNYDILMKSRNIEVRGDIILEIKYISNQLNYGQFMYHINTFLSSISHYETTQMSQKRVTPIIIFVLEGEKIATANSYKEKLRSYGKELRNNLRINFIDEKEISSMDAPRFIVEEL